MAPRTDSDGISNRKAFKPPSRVNKANTSTTGAKTARGGVAKPRGRPPKDPTKSAGASTSHGMFKSTGSKATKKAIAISSSEGEDQDDDDDANLDDSTVQNTRRTSGGHTSLLEDDAHEMPEPIPQQLLQRLLYEGFEDKGMKVGKEAMKVFGKYIETFVREALARAMLERQENGGDGLGEGFLQVEDLEKLAPQLLLDF